MRAANRARLKLKPVDDLAVLFCSVINGALPVRGFLGDDDPTQTA